MTGRRSEPTALKLLKGTRRDRINGREPRAQVSNSRCPAWLGGAGKAAWRRLSPALRKAGLLTALDTETFSVYCALYGMMRDTYEAIQSDGYTWITPSGQEKLTVKARFFVTLCTELRQFAGEFGLTPSSRGRLSIEIPSPEDEASAREWKTLMKPVPPLGGDNDK